MSTETTSRASTEVAPAPVEQEAQMNEKKASPGSEENLTSETSPRKAHGIIWFMIVTSILMANLLFALDNTVVANIQPAIVNDFHSLDKLSWLSVAFFLSSSSTNLLWGDIYARFSAKWTFCSSFVTFAVGSALCGAAPSIDALIVGRAICGVGGAGMYYGSMTLLTQLTSEQERALYLNLVGLTFGGGTVLGPIVGGGFAVSSATWRWAFYLNLVVGGVCAPIYISLLPTLNPRPGQTIRHRIVELDILGIVLLCGLVITTVMAISFGGVQYPWNSGSVIALFVVAFVLFWTFIGQQAFAIGTTVQNRAFPMHFFKSWTMIVLFIQVACAAVCVFTPIYYLPLYLQFVKGDSAITAGVRMLPFVAFQVVSGIVSGYLVGKTGYYVPWYILAGVLCIPGSVLLYLMDENTPLAQIYGYQILLGTGSGVSTQLSFTVASMKVDPVDIPRSTGWETFAQLGGPTIALSIANSIFLNKATGGIANLQPNLNATDISTLISDPSSPLLRNLPQNQQDQVVATVVSSMSNAYILTLIAGIFVLILAFRFKLKANLYK